MGTCWVITTSPGCIAGRILPDSTGVAWHWQVFTGNAVNARAQKARTSTRVLDPLRMTLPAGGRVARVAVVTVVAFMAASLRLVVEPAEDEVHRRRAVLRRAGQTLCSVIRLDDEPVVDRLADLQRLGELSAHAGVGGRSGEALCALTDGKGRVACQRAQWAFVDHGD